MRPVAFHKILATSVLVLGSLTGIAAGGAVLAHARRGRASQHAAAASTSSDDCKKDADCVVVVDDCCPCSQGGTRRALPKKQRDAYEKDRKKRCAGTMCAEVVSQDASCTQRAFCGAGICELGDLPSGAAARAPAPATAVAPTTATPGGAQKAK